MYKSEKVSYCQYTDLLLESFNILPRVLHADFDSLTNPFFFLTYTGLIPRTI